jgi:ABC-type polysaccharide/polyol phosphate transport system ATPase subunit
MISKNPAFIIEGVSKNYNSRNGQVNQVLSNISLTINKGEKWGLIGKNGAGKSTLLSILSGIVKPSSGKIYQFGEVTQILDVGSNFIPDLTGRENVYQFLRLHFSDSEEIKAKSELAFAFAEIGDYIDKPVKTYSNGMFLRLALSANIQFETAILIIDEVFSTGDAYFREKIKKYFNEKIGNNLTILFASHNANELMDYCTHCMWLDKGKIVKYGAVGEVLQSYYFEMAKANAIKINREKDEFGKNSELDLQHIDDFECEYFTLKIFEAIAPSGYDNITYDSGVVFRFKIYKKTNTDTLHPQIVISDYQKRDILTLIPPLSSQANKEIESLRTYTGMLTFEVKLERRLLTNGHFFAFLRFGKNNVVTSLYNEEAARINEPLLFVVNRPSTLEFFGRTENVFIEPWYEWQIQKN